MPTIERLEPRRLLSAPDEHWKLAWSDEFNGNHLDTGKWTIGLPWTGDDGTNRHFDSNFLSYITDNDVVVSNGTLKLLTEKRDVTSASGTVYHYTEGLITTAYKFSTTHGYLEVRAQVPTGQGPGLWPAFWTLTAAGWPPEDDIAEFFTSSNRFHQGLAYGSGVNDVHWDAIDTYSPLPGGFHTYGMEWGPGYQIFSMDGHITHATKGGYVPSSPMYLLLNSGVQSAQPPTASTTFPNAFEVDYVRVYKRDGLPALFNPGFEGGALGRWDASYNAAVVAGNAHSGAYVLQAQGAGSAVQQVVSGLKPNTGYVLTGWAEVDDPSNQARLGVKGFGGTDTFASIDSTGYTLATVPFTTGPIDTTATVYGLQCAGVGTARFDDFALHLAGQIENGNFDSGSLGGWTGQGSVSVVPDRAPHARFALREDGSAARAAQTIYGLTPNTTYRLSGWARTSGAKDPAVLGVSEYGEADLTDVVAGGHYRPLFITFTTGPSSTTADVFCSKRVGSGSAWFAGMRLVPPPPLTISRIRDQMMVAGHIGRPIRFTLGGFDLAPVQLTVAVSDPSVLSADDISVARSTASQTLILAPRSDAAGVATVTITAQDPSGRRVSTSFRLNVLLGRAKHPALRLA